MIVVTIPRGRCVERAGSMATAWGSLALMEAGSPALGGRGGAAGSARPLGIPRVVGLSLAMLLAGLTGCGQLGGARRQMGPLGAWRGPTGAVAGSEGHEAGIIRGQDPGETGDSGMEFGARPAVDARGNGGWLGDLFHDLANEPEGVEEPEEEEGVFPELGRDSLRASRVEPAKRDPYLFPGLVNLFVEDSWELEEEAEEERAEQLRRRSHADIRFPAPDTANFPNSAFTIPKGRVYIENSPVGFYGPSTQSVAQYNWEFLFRYGITDNLEFRLFSNGYTAARSPMKTTGFSPLAFDLKFNLWEENRRYFVPSVGLEAYIQTGLGSPRFNGGTQPSLNLLIDQTLPYRFQVEYSFSMSGVEARQGLSDYLFGFQWALQRSITRDFAVFTHGFYNAAALPRFPDQMPSRGNPEGPAPDDLTDETAVVVGGGAIWAVGDRLSIFGSYNVGLTEASPSMIGLLGFAIAF